MKNLICLFCLLAVSWAKAQRLDWAVQTGGTEFDLARDLAVDSEGNAYTTGSFSGKI